MFVKELLKKYNGKTVVDGVSFELPKGKVISLIGPNGAGKTTVFNMLTAVYLPTEGGIRRPAPARLHSHGHCTGYGIRPVR